MAIEFIELNNGTVEIFRDGTGSIGTLFVDEVIKSVFSEPLYITDHEQILSKMKELQSEVAK